MGKMMFAILTVFSVELALFMFAGSDYGSTWLWDLLWNPSNYENNLLYVAIGTIFTIAIGATIVIGNFYQVSQLGVYAGLSATILTFTASIVHLGSFVNASLQDIVGASLSSLITTLIVSPFLIGYIWAVIEWMRWN